MNEENSWGGKMDNSTGLQGPCPGLRPPFHQEDQRCGQSLSGRICSYLVIARTNQYFCTTCFSDKPLDSCLRNGLIQSQHEEEKIFGHLDPKYFQDSQGCLVRKGLAL